MKLEIISHCFCPPGVTHYAKMLEWQVAAINRHFGGFYQVDLFVCCDAADATTSETLQKLLDSPCVPGFRLYPEFMQQKDLFRRAIGRNYRALRTRADVVWFTDIDYFPGPSCLADLAANVDRWSSLMYPGEIQLNSSHAIGDEMLAAEKPGYIVPEYFVPKRLNKAIGGVMCIGGNVARQYGYLEGSKKWLRPSDPARGFRQCRCDVAYRRQMFKEFGAAQRFKCRSVYRIRHTTDGRDYDLAGVKGEEKENW